MRFDCFSLFFVSEGGGLDYVGRTARFPQYICI